MQPEVSEMQGRQTSDKANDEQSAIQGHGDKHEEAKKDQFWKHTQQDLVN